MERLGGRGYGTGVPIGVFDLDVVPFVVVSTPDDNLCISDIDSEESSSSKLASDAPEVALRQNEGAGI